MTLALRSRILHYLHSSQHIPPAARKHFTLSYIHYVLLLLGLVSLLRICAFLNYNLVMVLLYLIFVDWQWCLCCRVLNHFKLMWFVLSSDARVMWDQKTGRSRGYGFVSFRNQQVCWFSVPTIWICAPSESVLYPLLVFAEIDLFDLQDAQSAINDLNGMPLKTFLVQICFVCTCVVMIWICLACRPMHLIFSTIETVM